MAVKFDFKSFCINHSEKLVGGIVALLGLWGLAAASWEHAEVTPSQLKQQADDVRRQITGKVVWPEDKQLAFTKDMPDVRYLAGQLGHRDDLDFERFTMPLAWNDPLIPPRPKQAAVIVVPPIHPEASPIAVPIALPLDEEELSEALAGNGEEPEEVEVDEVRRDAERRFGGIYRPEEEAAQLALSGDITRAVMGGDEDFGGGDEDFGLMGGASTILATAARKVEWRAGVSVRMVVDLQEQRRKIRDALHITGDYAVIQQYVDYQQLHIERMQHHDGVWGDWEEVKLEDIGEVLLESLGQDVDLVSPAVTRPELTMPLPRRASGHWQNDEASHSMITDFELSPAEQEMQNRIDAIIQEDAEKAATFAPPARKQKKGFTPFLTSRYDLGNRAQTNYVNEKDWKEKALENVKQSYKRRGIAFGERELETFNKQFEATATADYRLLLVRFIDFTAERGFDYRYRVRLEMYNPNFEQIPDDLESPELAELETIVSAWSDPTSAVQVPMRYRNYATKIKSSRGGQQTVDFGVYYEDDGVLPVMGSVSVDVGMPIAGRQTTDRVDLEKSILESGDVIITTDELLCGVLPSTRLKSRDHKDLKEVLAKFGRQTPVSDLVSIVDTRGDIILRHAPEATPALSGAREFVAAIVSNYDSWRANAQRNLAAGGDEDFSGGDEDFDEDEQSGPTGYRGLGMRTGSALGVQGRGRPSGRDRRR